MCENHLQKVLSCTSRERVSRESIQIYQKLSLNEAWGNQVEI